MWDPCRLSPEVPRGIHASTRSPQPRDQHRSVLLTGTVPQVLGREEQGRGAQVPRCLQRRVRADLPMRLLACSPLPVLLVKSSHSGESAIGFDLPISLFHVDLVVLSLITYTH